MGMVAIPVLAMKVNTQGGSRYIRKLHAVRGLGDGNAFSGEYKTFLHKLWEAQATGERLVPSSLERLG